MLKSLKKILNPKNSYKNPREFTVPDNTEGFLCHADCERCVCCGRPIPEGTMICTACATLCEENDKRDTRLYAQMENKEKKDWFCEKSTRNP